MTENQSKLESLLLIPNPVRIIAVDISGKKLLVFRKQSRIIVRGGGRGSNRIMKMKNKTIDLR